MFCSSYSLRQCTLPMGTFQCIEMVQSMVGQSLILEVGVYVSFMPMFVFISHTACFVYLFYSWFSFPNGGKVRGTCGKRSDPRCASGGNPSCGYTALESHIRALCSQLELRAQLQVGRVLFGMSHMWISSPCCMSIFSFNNAREVNYFLYTFVLPSVEWILRQAE